MKDKCKKEDNDQNNEEACKVGTAAGTESLLNLDNDSLEETPGDTDNTALEEDIRLDQLETENQKKSQ